MRAKVAGQLASVTERVGKTSGKPYRSLQILQKTKRGAMFLVNARIYDNAKTLKVGENVDLEGNVSVFKFKDGTAGMSFDIFAEN